MNSMTAGALVLICIAAGWAAGTLLWRYLRQDDSVGQEPADGQAGETGAAATSDADPVRPRGDRTQRRPSAGRGGVEGLNDLLAFVGGALGIILGLLLVFAVQHFADAREASREEAAAAVALFNATRVFPADERAQLRRSTLCYMRAVADDDWEAARAGDLTGSANVNAWAARIHRGVDTVTLNRTARETTHFYLVDYMLKVSSDRAVRLQLALPEIPPAIWWVIFICSFAFTALLTVHSAARRRLQITALGISSLVLVAIVMSLAALDEPYTGTSATVTPIAMRSGLTTLMDSFPEVDWGPCPRLATEQAR